MKEHHPSPKGKATRASSSPDSMHPQQPFLLGICEALGPDAPLRRVVFLMVLWQIDGHGISSGELERRVDEAVGTAQSTTSRTVRVLVGAGLVERYLCPRDRRSRLIRLTGVARLLLRSLADPRPVEKAPLQERSRAGPKRSISTERTPKSIQKPQGNS